MGLKKFWDWLTTSRSYRLLLEHNKQLQSDLTTLRAENYRLLLALSPALRSLEHKAEVNITPPVPAPEAKSETDQPKPRPKSRPTWRETRAKLEFAESSKARKLDQVKALYVNQP